MTSLKQRQFPVSEDKENKKILIKKSATFSAKPRNPLSDLTDNVTQQKQKVQENSSKTLKTKVKSRASSTSEVHVKLSKKITKRSVEKEEEVFVGGDEHYINFLTKNEENKVEKINLPICKVGDLRIKSETKKPAQKTNLIKKLSCRRKRINVDDFYKECLYDKDYFTDNYRYNLQTEKKYIFRRDLLKKYVDVSYRMIVVNWINCAYQTLQLTERTYFAAIRMFDCVLIMTKLPSRKYVLIGIVCLWIANKFFDIRYIKAQKLVYACGGKFQKLQLFSTEKDILKLLNFDVNFADPTVFLFYYLKREGVENYQKIRYGALFLLEMFTVLLEFSSLAPSVLAAMALHLVLVKYKFENCQFVEYINSHLLDRDIFLRKTKEMENFVKQVLDYEATCSNIVEKYSKEENFYVAQDFKAK